MLRLKLETAHRFRKGSAGLDAHLDDYAFLVWGLIELYEADFNTHDLQTAIALNGEMLKHFQAPQGGLYFTADDAPKLLVRPLDAYDGAIPSGNSVAMMNLLRLARMTGDTELEKQSAAIIHAFSKEMDRMPSVFNLHDVCLHVCREAQLRGGAGRKQELGGWQSDAARHPQALYPEQGIVMAERKTGTTRTLYHEPAGDWWKGDCVHL